MAQSQSDDEHPVLAVELANGEASLEAGDLEEALMRAARALAVAPSSPDATAFADRAIAAAPDPLSTLRLHPGVAFGIAALRARALAAADFWCDAIELSAELAGFRPELPYLTWAMDWIDAALAHPSSDLVARVVASIRPLVDSLFVETEVSEGAKINAAAACDVLARLTPLARSLDVSFLRATLFRRLHRFEEAIHEAEAAYAQQPCWLSAVELAAAHRDTGHVDDALTFFRKASEHDPTDRSALLDAGDLLLANDRLQEAKTAYERVLALEPHQPWAEASRLFLASTLDGDRAARKALETMSRQSGRAGERARQLLERPS